MNVCVWRFRKILKKKKTTISFFMFVCLSVRPRGKTRPPLGAFFVEFGIWIFFEKTCQETLLSITFCQEYQALYIKTCAHAWRYLPEFLSEWHVFHTNVVQKVKTHFMFNNISPKILPFIIWKNFGESDRARWLYNTAHALCMLYSWGYTNTPRTLVLLDFPWQQWLREGLRCLSCFIPSAT